MTEDPFSARLREILTFKISTWNVDYNTKIVFWLDENQTIDISNLIKHVSIGHIEFK